MLYTRFSVTFEIQRLLSEFDEAKAELNPHGALPAQFINELRRHALVESVHYSTRLEGNSLSPREVESVISGESVAAPRNQIQEVQNYQEALAYVQSLTVSQRPAVTEETLQTIHFIVCKGLEGDYAPGHIRTDQNYVRDRVSQRRLYLPPGPEQVPELMHEFLALLDQFGHQHPVLLAGLAHLNFVAIHPFTDGNGRTARVLETLVLLRSGYLDVDLVSLEAYFGRDSQGYYRAIATSLGPEFEPTRDVTAWSEYYVTAHIQQAREAIEAMREVDAQLGALEEEFTLNPERALVLWLACRRGAVSNRVVRQATDRSHDSTARLLADLVEAQLLARTGRGRAVAYTPADAVRRTFERATQAQAELDTRGQVETVTGP